VAALVRKKRLMWIVEISSDFIVLLLLPKFDCGYVDSPLTFLYLLLVSTCTDRGQNIDLRENFWLDDSRYIQQLNNIKIVCVR
jgi:hypothetical protein